MTRVSTPTLLSTDRWARILGINPIHFSGASGSMIWPTNGACQDVWPQYSWQTSDELVGREDVGLAIASAEEDIKREMGCSPAATWEVDEAQAWSWRDPRPRSIKTEYGYVIAPGRRAVSLIEAGAGVVYTDPDNDNWDELATITVTTDITDPREVKVYYAGHEGEQEWEIRPLKKVTFSSGVATIKVDAWLLIDPDLWERLPTNDGFQSIDVAVEANFVAEVDVYREYNDTTQSPVTFFTNGGSCYFCGGYGCQVCGESSYGGCFGVTNSRLGVVTTYPATYSDGAWRNYWPCDVGYPQRVTLSYYAGMMDKAYSRRSNLDSLSHHLAEAIVWLSVARLPKAICSCNNIRDRVEMLQVDATRMREAAVDAALYARFTEMDVFRCPFGTRVGELMAWQRIVRIIGPIGDGGLL